MSEEIIDYEKLYAIISSRSRIEIVKKLYNTKCITIPQLCNELKFSIAKTMYELKVLEKLGLIKLKDSIVCISELGSKIYDRFLKGINVSTNCSSLCKISDIFSLRNFTIQLLLVNEKIIANNIFSLGVDSIFTDRPDLLNP